MLLHNNSTTIKFNNKSNNRDFNIFVEEYFGGSDVFIYVNGKRVKEIAHIQYAVQERHKPIYGYGSRTFDDVAIGDRIVVGAMKVPVKNPHYNGQYIPGEPLEPSQARIDVGAYKRQAPEWVYNYKDTEEEKVNDDTDTITEKVQEFLNVERTGRLDFETKRAISSFRESKGLHPGCYIDNELLNAIDEGYMLAQSLGEIYLYLEPMFKNTINHLAPNTKMTIIAHSDDSFFVRLHSGMVGYVRKGSVELI